MSGPAIRFCPKCQCETERYASGGCKVCIKATGAARRAADPEKAKARDAAYRSANPDRIKAIQAAFRAANPNRRKEINAKWRAANPDKMKAASAAWKAANPEKAKATTAAWRAAHKGQKKANATTRLGLTQARLSELYLYEQNSGLFTRAKMVKGRGIDAPVGKTSNGYLLIGVDGFTYSAHRLAWLLVHGYWPTGQIDHINGIRSDNRLSNLRDVSHQINAQNLHAAKSSSRSGVLGVGFDPANKKWRALITVNHKRICLGRHGTAQEAYAAYVQAKRMYHQGNQL